MSIDYKLNDREYSFDYQKLKDRYDDACGIPDGAFLNSIPEMLHLACIICYIKNMPIQDTLSDVGIIHELAHLVHLPDEPVNDVTRIRKLFEKVCKLA